LPELEHSIHPFYFNLGADSPLDIFIQLVSVNSSFFAKSLNISFSLGGRLAGPKTQEKERDRKTCYKRTCKSYTEYGESVHFTLDPGKNLVVIRIAHFLL
jgi:hypothetical protein